MKILIVDDNDPRRSLVASCLERSLGQVEIIEVTNARMAKALYSSDPYFELILGTLDLQGSSFLDFHLHLQEAQANVATITYSQSSEDDLQTIPGSNHLHLDEDSINQFYSQLLSFIPADKIIQEDQRETHKPRYQKVRLFYFWRFHQTPFPVYLKLGPEKFVKILNKDQSYGPDFIEKYEGKHQNYLYIKTESFDSFLNLLLTRPLYEEDPSLSPEEKIMRSHHFIQSMAMSSGLTPNLIEVAEESIAQVEEFSKTKKSLSKMMLILKERGGYNSDHAMLLSYLTSSMCDRLGWSARRSKEKLCMASLFHDITLVDQELAALSYLDDIKDIKLSREKVNKYHKHPEKCAELVVEALSQYPQVDLIISAHHERPDGGGFPHGRDYNQLGPLPSLFIVAHDYVSRLFKKNFDLGSSMEILTEMEEHYRLGHFSKCLNALKDILVEEELAAS